MSMLTFERRQAKRSSRNESGEEVPRKRACIDLCHVFISASPEQSEIPLTAHPYYKKISPPHLESKEELSVRITAGVSIKAGYGRSTAACRTSYRCLFGFH